MTDASSTAGLPVELAGADPNQLAGMVGQLSDGMVLEPAVAYQRVAQTMGVPRHNH